ncbi:MAG: class I SAM-dependent methyltransferase [Candidatus Hodarchaeota archaeon]
MRERRVLEVLKPQKSDKVLEVGFGKGKILKTLAPHIGQLVGVDIEEDLVLRGSQRLDFDNLELKRAPAENLPFEEASFDAVVCSFSYHEFSDGTQALAEIYRVLKPLGRLVIVDPSKDYRLVRLLSRLDKHAQMRAFEELKKEMLVAGFSNIIGEKYRTKWILGEMWLEGTKPGN